MFGEKRDFTDQEIISILARTRIPTIVIEGKDDLFVFRRIQQDVGAANISLFAVGGRSRVIFAFRNRPADGTSKFLFFADKDEWEFSAVPQEFDETCFETAEGYSIENDLVRDGGILCFMYAAERARFDAEILRFSRWFAIQMARFLRGEAADLSKYVGRVLDSEAEYTVDCTLAPEEPEPSAVLEVVQADPLKSLRGKSLLQIIARQLNAPGRTARHQPKALLEAAAAVKGPNYMRILGWVRANIEDGVDPV